MALFASRQCLFGQTGLRFVPITPCRVVDTRNPNGPFGGPQISGGTSRDFTIPAGACGVSSTAQAYSLNVAVVPPGALGYLTLWPAGQARPGTSTLNSDGRIKSNAAIVFAGAGGAISVFASDTTHVILDISGYFVSETYPNGLAFYPITPCRVADTRWAPGPLGGPSLAGGQSRTFPILSGSCGIPAWAQAYSLNLTAVPGGPLGYLTAWPTGQTRPTVATLNALTGTVTANAAIVPAGTSGSIDVFASDSTNLVIDANGYFAPPGAGGLSLYGMTPCRVVDTRQTGGPITGGTTQDVNVSPGACTVPTAAQAYVLSATVIPPASLGYLTLWPQGQTRPLVATLNALDGAITSNMAIVLGANGWISAFASDTTNLLLDISGFFSAQYSVQQLTTVVSPAGWGTVSPNCPFGCWYSANLGVQVTAAANPGYEFSNFSGALSGTVNPQSVTMNGPKAVTANFVAPLTLPAGLKGINYFPRGHAWYSMLYDWYTQDCATSTIPVSCVNGQTVKQIVSADLQMLHNNNFNFVHLYLWDQDIVQQGLLGASAGLVQQGFGGPGFTGWDDGGPGASPNNQWSALADFVSQAKGYGIWVFLEFAVGRPGKEIQLEYSASTVGANYAGWVNQFIDQVAGFQNVLIWGVTYGTGQAISGPFWQAAYPAISSHLQQSVYPYPAGRALLAVDANFYLAGPGGVQPQLGTYRWGWQQAQQEAYQWRQFQPPPDVYAFELYNANAGDLQAALECAAGQANPVCAAFPACQGNPVDRCPIPFSKMIPREFATGSSLEAPPIGNGTASYLDENTPTTTAAGQQQWLMETLCSLSTHNIPNTGYYGLYDSASWWEQKYDYTGFKLAANGYWGLQSEVSSFSGYGAGGVKPAWAAMNSSGPCNVPFGPVLTLQADATYYTVNDTATLTYTDANVTSLALNEPVQNAQSYDCASGAPLQGSGLLGSCAFAVITAANTGTITLTGANQDVDGVIQPGTSSTGVAYSVNVGPAPIVTGIVDVTNGQSCNYTVNPSCAISVNQTDIVEIFGLGFNPTGGNTVELLNQSSQAWFYEADGLYYWDDSRTQINVQTGCYAAPGLWTLYVRSPNSGTPSNGVSITLNAGGGCS